MGRTTELETTIRNFLISDIVVGEGAENITLDTALLAEGLIDSMALMRIVTFLESELDAKIEDEALLPENFESIRAIASLVDKAAA
jgi:acyl carrier protein